MTAPFIMLVDDEVSFVKTVAKRLVKRNIKTLMAFSAEEGLEKLKENQDLDVIVLDVKMPGMNGIDALKEIKTVSKNLSSKCKKLLRKNNSTKKRSKKL